MPALRNVPAAPTATNCPLPYATLNRAGMLALKICAQFVPSVEIAVPENPTPTNLPLPKVIPFNPPEKPVTLNLLLPGLTPYTTYHYRAVATNILGLTTGADVTFTPMTTAGDQNGDVIVTEAEINAAFANYLANSPWLYLTNVAGLGGTNVTFALENTPPLTFTVEYSTNLVDWYPLGPATPRYLFTDTNAPALPQRSYRLRYPRLRCRYSLVVALCERRRTRDLQKSAAVTDTAPTKKTFAEIS